MKNDAVPGTAQSRDDALSEESIRRYLRTDGLQLQVLPVISSTNTVLKNMAEDGAEEGVCLIAGEQTAGRGRMGRSFYSPAGSGLYLSVLLRPAMNAADAVSITACAAVAVAEALESLAPVQAQIKWVNDVYVEGRKVCGILTEASLNGETGTVNYLVVGIGINTRPPEGGFPAELQGIAGDAFGEKIMPDLRCRLAAAVLDRLIGGYAHLREKPWLEEYRRRSLVTGKEIRMLMPGKEPEDGTAVGIADDFSLLVRKKDGSFRRLSSGEVSIRL